MTKITKIVAAVALNLALGAVALAGDNPPACNPDPGIMQSPPCASAQLLNDESGSPTDNTVTSTDLSAITLTEAALDIVQTLLTVF